MAERKLVIVKTTGMLPEINLYGPILTPTKLPIDNIIKMISNGKSVYECYPNDPSDKDKRVKLTLDNVKKNNFTGVPIKEESKVEEKKPVEEPKKVETPAPAPVKEEPKVEEPKVEEPVAPVVEEKVEETAVETPVVEETKVEEKPAEQPKNQNNNKKNKK